MRLMWLWVLLYALGAGFIMPITGFIIMLGLSEVAHPSIIAIDIIGGIGFGLAFLAAMGGFWVLIAGIISLLKRGRFAKGRVVSLIGIRIYYVGAFGIVLASSVFWFFCDFSLECFWVLYYYFIAAVVILPGFFIMRKFRRLQKAEKGET